MIILGPRKTARNGSAGRHRVRRGYGLGHTATSRRPAPADLRNRRRQAWDYHCHIVEGHAVDELMRAHGLGQLKSHRRLPSLPRAHAPQARA